MAVYLGRTDSSVSKPGPYTKKGMDLACEDTTGMNTAPETDPYRDVELNNGPGHACLNQINVQRRVHGHFHGNEIKTPPLPSTETVPGIQSKWSSNEIEQLCKRVDEDIEKIPMHIRQLFGKTSTPMGKYRLLEMIQKLEATMNTTCLCNSEDSGHLGFLWRYLLREYHKLYSLKLKSLKGGDPFVQQEFSVWRRAGGAQGFQLHTGCTMEVAKDAWERFESTSGDSDANNGKEGALLSLPPAFEYPAIAVGNNPIRVAIAKAADEGILYLAEREHPFSCCFLHPVLKDDCLGYTMADINRVACNMHERDRTCILVGTIEVAMSICRRFFMRSTNQKMTLVDASYLDVAFMDIAVKYVQSQVYVENDELQPETREFLEKIGVKHERFVLAVALDWHARNCERMPNTTGEIEDLFQREASILNCINGDIDLHASVLELLHATRFIDWAPDACKTNLSMALIASLESTSPGDTLSSEADAGAKRGPWEPPVTFSLMQVGWSCRQ